MTRIRDIFRHAIRSGGGRLILLLIGVGLLWLGSAAVDYFLFDQFATYGDALWSAFVHILDPSALQDDDDVARRVVGTFQVLVGLVFVIGVVFTVFAEGVSQALVRATSQDMPLRVKDHLLFIGGHDMVPTFVERIVELDDKWGKSQRAGFSRIVVLAPEEMREQRNQIRNDVRQVSGGLKVTVVIGNTLDVTGLALVSPEHARDIVIARTSTAAHTTDVYDHEVIRSSLALHNYLERSGVERKAGVYPLFRRGADTDAIWGVFESNWDAIVGDRAMAAILAISIMEPVFTTTLAGVGGASLESQFVVLSRKAFSGVRFGDLVHMLPNAIPIGVRSGSEARSSIDFAPDADYVLGAEDRVVAVATSSDIQVLDGELAKAKAAAPIRLKAQPPQEEQRVLITGLSQNVVALIDELGSHDSRQFAVTLLASEAQQHFYKLHDPPENVSLDLITGDGSDPLDVENALNSANPSVVLVSTGQTVHDVATADSESTLAMLHARRLTADTSIPLIHDRYFMPYVNRVSMERRVKILSSVQVLAQAVALSVTNYEGAMVGEAMVDKGCRLQVVRFEPESGRAEPFSAVYEAMLADGSVPLGVARDGLTVALDLGINSTVEPGELVLSLARASGAPLGADGPAEV